MSSTFRFLALAVLLVILAGAFFSISSDDGEEDKDFPPTAFSNKPPDG